MVVITVFPHHVPQLSVVSSQHNKISINRNPLCIYLLFMNSLVVQYGVVFFRVVRARNTRTRSSISTTTIAFLCIRTLRGAVCDTPDALYSAIFNSIIFSFPDTNSSFTRVSKLMLDSPVKLQLFIGLRQIFVLCRRNFGLIWFHTLQKK